MDYNNYIYDDPTSTFTLATYLVTFCSLPILFPPYIAHKYLTWLLDSNYILSSSFIYMTRVMAKLKYKRDSLPTLRHFHGQAMVVPLVTLPIGLISTATVDTHVAFRSWSS